MKRLFGLLLLLASFAYGQNLVQITASNIMSGGGVPLAGGLMYWAGVDTHGHPISYQIGGGGQTVNYPITCTISSGAISGTCQVANVTLTNPVNICFSVTVKDAHNRVVLGGPGSGYTCVQPQTTSSWCTNGVCNFDQYVPSQPGVTPTVIRPPTANSLGGVYAASCPLGQKAVGTSTTGNPSCAQEDGSFGLELETPTPLDSGNFAYLGHPEAIVITRVSCNADGGTVQINLDVRSNSDWTAPGTPALATPLVCSSTVSGTTTISTGSIPANSPVALLIPNINGLPTMVRVRVYYNLQGATLTQLRRVKK